jgi:hypothetical protein
MNPSILIDRYIARHPDWRGERLAEVRSVVRAAAPDITEEWKWMGTPTWSRNGIVCICNAFKDMVKVTFLDGAKLEDPDGVFNAELGGHRWRAIKLFEHDPVNAAGLTKLVRAAVAWNEKKLSASATKKRTASAGAKTGSAKTGSAKTGSAKAGRSSPKAAARTARAPKKPSARPAS